MLRYLGYDAKYVTDTVSFTKEQLLAWTNTDTIEAAKKIYSLQGRVNPQQNDNYYRCLYRYVQLIENGQTYYLDVCFKQYEQQDTVYDAVESGYTFDNVDAIIDNTDLNALNAAMADSQNTAALLEGNKYALYDKKIVQKSFSSLPTAPVYLTGIDQLVSDTITDEESDTIEFSFGGSSKFYRSAELYNKPITISYVVSNDSKELADMLIGIDTSSIFSLPAKSMGQAFSVTPVLKIGDENVLTGPSLNIGSSQKFSITIRTGNTQATYEEDLTAGEICSIIFDIGMISSNELLSAYQETLQNTESVNQKHELAEDTDETLLNEANIYNSDYLGSLLRLTGVLYFAQLDIATHNLAESSDIHAENLLRCGIIGYKPEVYETGIQKHGQFFVDIMSNGVQPIQKSQNAADEFTFNFSRGLISSELESTVLEEVLNVQSLSTAAIFRQAEEENIPLVILSDSSEHTVADLNVDSDDSARIQNELESGNVVITIQSEITCGDWSGIGYIVMSDGGAAQRYAISGGYNGGITFDPVGLSYAATVGINIAMIAETVVLVGGMLAAMTSLAILPVAAVLVCVLAIELMVVEIIHQTELYCEYMFQGNADAGIEIHITSAITVATFGLDKGYGFISSKFAASRLSRTYGTTVIQNVVDSGFEVAEVNAKVKTFKSLGMTESTIQTLLTDAKCMYLSDDILKVIANNTDNSKLLARIVLKNGDDSSNALLKTGVLDELHSMTSCKKILSSIFVMFGKDDVIIIMITSSLCFYAV